jgi:hypothetical protein
VTDEQSTETTLDQDLFSKSGERASKEIDGFLRRRYHQGVGSGEADDAAW